MNAWTLSYGGFDADTEGTREALCTTGNGYVATRGVAPESRADGVHYPGTYAAGCYNRLRDTVAGKTVENESLVNLPNWLVLTVAAGDGPWLGQPGADLIDHRQDLDTVRPGHAVNPVGAVMGDPGGRFAGRHDPLSRRCWIVP